MSSRHIFAYLFLFATSPALTAATEQVHLLGFVEQLCPDRPYCFDLRVEPEYIAIAGERINVRYESVTTIFDPENYELTLQQSNIIPGSHLRLLMTHDPDWPGRGYQANYIWIGD
jgi:hypothetical protein